MNGILGLLQTFVKLCCCCCCSCSCCLVNIVPNARGGVGFYLPNVSSFDSFDPLFRLIPLHVASCVRVSSLAKAHVVPFRWKAKKCMIHKHTHSGCILLLWSMVIYAWCMPRTVCASFLLVAVFFSSYSHLLFLPLLCFKSMMLLLITLDYLST